MKKKQNQTPLVDPQNYLHTEELNEVNRLWSLWKTDLEIAPDINRTRHGNFPGLFELGIRMDLKWARKVLATEPYYGSRLIVAAAYDQNRE